MEEICASEAATGGFGLSLVQLNTISLSLDHLQDKQDKITHSNSHSMKYLETIVKHKS